MRLAIVTTHPIQYYAPLLRLLANEPGIDLKVFYTWSQSASGKKYDVDFGKVIEWDIPLLEGYTYEFVENISAEPGVHHFRGINNPGLKKKIQDWKPDGILVIGWNFKSHLGVMRFFKGKIPVIFRGDSTLLDERPGIKKILRRIFLKWVYSHADYAMYVGKNNYDYFVAHGLKEDQLFFVPHSIDNSRFHDYKFESIEVEEWRRKLGIERTDLVFLFAGKLEPRKDPYWLLNLAQSIGDPRIKILIVGNGPMENELKLAGKKDNRIIFLDFQNQQKMPLVYRLADIFLLPSKSETWGLAVNEAMACNLPVIVSDKVGAVSDLVKEDVNGWIITSNKEGIEKIKLKMQITSDIPEILREMGKKSWEIVQNYSYRVAIDKMKQAFKTIKKKNPDKEY